jgi:hypothetical protein
MDRSSNWSTCVHADHRDDMTGQEAQAPGHGRDGERGERAGDGADPIAVGDGDGSSGESRAAASMNAAARRIANIGLSFQG